MHEYRLRRLACCTAVFAAICFPATAQKPKKAGYDIRVVDYDLGWVAGASLLSRAGEDTTAEFRMDIDFSHW